MTTPWRWWQLHSYSTQHAQARSYDCFTLPYSFDIITGKISLLSSQISSQARRNRPVASAHVVLVSGSIPPSLCREPSTSAWGTYSVSDLYLGLFGSGLACSQVWHRRASTVGDTLIQFVWCKNRWIMKYDLVYSIPAQNSFYVGGVGQMTNTSTCERTMYRDTVSIWYRHEQE